jgi:Tol biopolymer transport system component
MAFVSDESGRGQVYVTSFPAPGKRAQASTAGGLTPRWRRDGRELYFVSSSRQLMAVSVNASGVTGALRALFDVRDWREYDVAPDGRFIAVVSQQVAGQQPLAVILNWRAPGVGK